MALLNPKMRIIYTVVFLSVSVFFSASTTKANCACEKYSPSRFNVGSDPLVMISKKTVSKIQGAAFDISKKPFSKAYIYLFPISQNTADKKFDVFDLEVNQVISACETGVDGQFCFENIPQGKYVVCGNTSDGSYKTTCVFTKLKPEKKNLKRKLSLRLEIQDL